MAKTNLTVGAFSAPLVEGFIRVKGNLVPALKSLERFASILTDHGNFNLRFVLPESGQLGVLTESGYEDGVLGLMQEKKADMCFLPIPLDTQRAPGHFSPVITEESSYIISYRNFNDYTSTVNTSLTSFTVIPLLFAALTIFLLELTAVKHFKMETLLSTIFKTFSISFYQNLSNRSLYLCLIEIIIMMFPVYIFNSAFSTATIVGTTDSKVDSLKDIITYGKIPYYCDVISRYDFFKGKVNKEYADIYELSVSKGFGEPFPFGIIPFEQMDRMATFVSDAGRKVTALALHKLKVIKPNQDLYYSSKPFHKSSKAILFRKDTFRLHQKKFSIMAHRMLQSGLTTKIEDDIYVQFLLLLYSVSLNDFYQSVTPSKSNILNWQSLNFNGFKQVFYLLLLMLILSIIVLFIELTVHHFVSA